MGLGGRQEEEVSLESPLQEGRKGWTYRDELIAHHPDDVSHLDIAPFFVIQVAVPHHVRLPPIHITVRDVSLL